MKKDFNSFSNRYDFFIPSSYTWRVPTNTSKIRLTGVGGGGAGGIGYLLTQDYPPLEYYGGGGGGGAGGFFQVTIPCSCNDTLVINVGSGGICGVDLGNGVGNGLNTSVKFKNNDNYIAIAYGGSSPHKNTIYNSTIAYGIGGDAISNYASILLKGGNGGYGGAVYNYTSYSAILFAGGGGGGIGLANGANGVTSRSYYTCIGGSGAGAFGGHAGKSVIYNGSNEGYVGGGGGVGYVGGDSSTSARIGGGGAGVFTHGYIGWGGSDYEGSLTYLNSSPTYFKGGGGAPSNTNATKGTIGSSFLPTPSYDLDLLPSMARFFFRTFGFIAGAAGGSFINTLNTGTSGQDSSFGGVGAISTYTTNLTSANYFRGGNSLFCGGGGGSVGSFNTPSAVASFLSEKTFGGSGNLGGGGGGGAYGNGGAYSGGNGGAGTFILEYE